MIQCLRKHKLEKLLFSKPKTYFILQLLPVKEHYFVEWVDMLSKYNIQVKFLKTKQSGGLLRTSSSKIQEICLKKVFNGSTLYLQPFKSFEGSFFKQFLQFTKDNQNLLINSKKKYIITHVYDSGNFYHVNEILNIEKETQFEVPTAFVQELHIPIQKTIQQLTLSYFQISFLIDIYIYKCQHSIKYQN